MTTHFRFLPLCCSLVSLGGLGCRPTLPPPAELVDVPAAESLATPASEIGAETPTPIYGHVRIPNPSGLLAEIGAQLVPPAQRSMFGETQLRMLLGIGLEGRQAVSEHIDLTRPMGCVFTSPKRHDQPLACVVGYVGGIGQLVSDLGPDGYVSGADDHAAYRFEGQAVYFNAMGDDVVIAFAPDLSAATWSELEREIVHASASAVDIHGAARLSVIFEDAHDEITEALEELARLSAPQPTGTADLDAVQAATRAAQTRQLMSFGELDLAEIWLELEPTRLRLGYRGTARPSTATAKAYAARPEARIDRTLVEQLPAEASMIAGFDFDMNAMKDDPMFGSYMNAMANVEGTGAATAISELYRENMEIWGEIFAGQGAAGFIVLPGTVGGIVFAYRIRPSVDAREKMRGWMDRMKEVAAKEGAYFQLEVRHDAIRAGKVRGDLVSMRPSDALLAEVKGNPGWTALRDKVGSSLRLHIAFAQRDDVMYMTMSLQKPKRYLQRVLAAAQGKRSLGRNADAMALLDQHADDSMVVAFDIAETVSWLVGLGAFDEPPTAIGGGFDDLVISSGAAGPDKREVVVDVSQELVDSLLLLAG